MSGIKGHKSQQRLAKALKNYTEAQSVDPERFVTVQEMSGRRHALDVLIHGAYQISVAPITVGTGSNIRQIVTPTPHGASANDIIRLADGTQFSALSVPDVNTIITSVELPYDPTGSTFTIWRHVTPAYNSDGSLNVTSAPAVIEYKLNGVSTQVARDTVTPANSRPLPVELMSASGVDINVTAGDINVEILHNGAAPSSVQIGDGTRTVLTTLANELKVSDATVSGQLPATLGQKAMTASMSVAIASDQSAVPVSSTQLPATLGSKTSALSTSVVLASDQAPLQSLGLLLTSATNSTTTPLLANATFTGASIDTSGYSAISVIINSDQASAANGVNIEYSGDGTNWEEATLGTFTPGTGTNTGQVFGGNIRARYARIVYTNGAVNQTTFRLSTTLRSMPMAGDIVDMEAVLGNNSHGIVTKGVITGKNTAGGGSFVDVKVNPSGSLAADVTSNGLNLVSTSQIPATLGQKTMANSLAVTMASDQTAIPVSQVYSLLSTNNSSVTPLAGNATFTGTADDALNYSSVTLYLEVDQSGTLNIEYSSNGTNWDDIQTYPITVTTPGTPQFFQFSTAREGRFFRIVYTNGASAQAVFRLQSILNILPLSGEISQVSSPVIAGTDALVTKGVIYGLTTGGGGGYVAVKVNPSGALTSDVTSNGLFLPSTSQVPATLGQKTMAASLAVVLASDQTTVPTAQAATTPTYNESLTVANTGVTTITKPANAKGCKVITPSGNTVNLHITVDGVTTPTTTVGGVGMEIQPGRAEDFTGVGNLQAIAQTVATGQKISVHWYV